MGLINKSYLMTLNQRVAGSSPAAPTKKSQKIELKSPLSQKRPYLAQWSSKEIWGQVAATAAIA